MTSKSPAIAACDAQGRNPSGCDDEDFRGVSLVEDVVKQVQLVERLRSEFCVAKQLIALVLDLNGVRGLRAKGNHVRCPRRPASLSRYRTKSRLICAASRSDCTTCPSARGAPAPTHPGRDNGPALVGRDWRGFLIHGGDYRPFEPAVHGAKLTAVAPTRTTHLKVAVGATRLALGTAVSHAEQEPRSGFVSIIAALDQIIEDLSDELGFPDHFRDIQLRSQCVRWRSGRRCVCDELACWAYVAILRGIE